MNWVFIGSLQSCDCVQTRCLVFNLITGWNEWMKAYWLNEGQFDQGHSCLLCLYIASIVDTIAHRKPLYLLQYSFSLKSSCHFRKRIKPTRNFAECETGNREISAEWTSPSCHLSVSRFQGSQNDIHNFPRTHLFNVRSSQKCYHL